MIWCGVPYFFRRAMDWDSSGMGFMCSLCGAPGSQRCGIRRSLYSVAHSGNILNNSAGGIHGILHDPCLIDDG